MRFHLKDFTVSLNVSRIANLHYFEFTKQYHTEDDFHNFCELLYVDKGNITVTAENYSGNLSDNQLIIHRPNEIHALTCNSSVAPNVIIIGFECKNDVLALLSKAPFTLSSEYKKMLAEIMKEGMSVYAPPYDMPNLTDMKKRAVYPFGADQMIKLKLEMLLISMIRDIQSPIPVTTQLGVMETRLAEIHQYLTDHYTEKILLDNVCFLFGTNKTTLCQSFRQEYGMTVLGYINSLKIREAKSLLRENQLSVTEISEILGFTSIHYFCRMFKKFVGQSPKEYAKSIRSKLNL